MHLILYSLYWCFFWSFVLAVKRENSSLKQYWRLVPAVLNFSNCWEWESFSSSCTKFKSIFQVAFQLLLSCCMNCTDRARMLHLLDYFLNGLWAILWSRAEHFQPVGKTEYINKSITVNKHCQQTVFMNMFSHKDRMHLRGEINYTKIEREP